MCTCSFHLEQGRLIKTVESRHPGSILSYKQDMSSSLPSIAKGIFRGKYDRTSVRRHNLCVLGLHGKSSNPFLLTELIVAGVLKLFPIILSFEEFLDRYRLSSRRNHSVSSVVSSCNKRFVTSSLLLYFLFFCARRQLLYYYCIHYNIMFY